MRDKMVVALTILTFVIISSGCTKETPIVNNASATPALPTGQAQNGSSLSTVPAFGYVYLDGRAISNASIEAISFDGSDHRSATTNDNGSYIVNIKPDTGYSITARYRGLQHTVWPAYLPDETDTFHINLTTTPGSTIEGSGYTIISKSPFENDNRYKIYNHTRWSGFLIEARSAKDNATISAITNDNGDYSLTVQPDILYNMTGYISAQNMIPIAMLHYRNEGGLPEGYINNITVRPNETVLVDYVIPMP